MWNGGEQMINERKLKARMIEMNISQRDLANQTGKGLNHINEVINNKVSPRLDLVQKISNILELDNSQKIDIFLS